MDMPVDLPRSKKPEQSVTSSVYQWLEKPLNMLALVIGIGLCFWAINMGVVSTNTVNSPSAVTDAAAQKVAR
jgi:hypothetical protein